MGNDDGDNDSDAEVGGIHGGAAVLVVMMMMGKKSSHR